MSIFKKKVVKIQDRIKPDEIYNGHKFYFLDPTIIDKENPKYLPTQKAIEYTVALCDLERRINDPELKQMQVKMAELLDAGKLSEAIILNGIFGVRLEIEDKEDIYIKLGKAVTVIDEENPGKESTFYDNLKNELLKDEVVRSFFLHQGTRIYNHLTRSTNTTDQEDSSTKRKRREIIDIFRKQILKP